MVQIKGNEFYSVIERPVLDVKSPCHNCGGLLPTMRDIEKCVGMKRKDIEETKKVRENWKG